MSAAAAAVLVAEAEVATSIHLLVCLLHNNLSFGHLIHDELRDKAKVKEDAAVFCIENNVGTNNLLAAELN